MKRYWLTGLIILVPILITFWIIHWVFDLLTHPFIGMIKEAMDHFGIASEIHPFFVFFARILVLVIVFCAIFLLGVVGQKLFLKWLFSSAEKLFLKIPIVKTIYKISVQIVKPFLSPNAKPFKKTVAVKFPTEKSLALGFLTGDVPLSVQKAINEPTCKTVFLPTAPHPISGFLIMVKESEIKDIDISTEDVFKILLSCGNYRPGEDEQNKAPPS